MTIDFTLSPDYLAAMSVRYASTLHVAPLPSGKLAVFHTDWSLQCIGTPEELVEFFRHPPPLPERKSRPSSPPPASVEDLLSSLDLI